MVDSLQVFEILKAGSIPDLQAKAMAHAIPSAESAIALDVKSVLENELRLSSQKSGAFESRMDVRFDAMDRRFDAFAKRMDERFAAFEMRMEERFAAFEKRIDARFDAFEAKLNERFVAFDARTDKKLSDAKGEMLRWTVGLWLVQLGAVAGLLKLFLK